MLQLFNSTSTSTIQQASHQHTFFAPPLTLPAHPTFWKTPRRSRCQTYHSATNRSRASALNPPQRHKVRSWTRGLQPVDDSSTNTNEMHHSIGNWNRGFHHEPPSQTQRLRSPSPILPAHIQSNEKDEAKDRARARPGTGQREPPVARRPPRHLTKDPTPALSVIQSSHALPWLEHPLIFRYSRSRHEKAPPSLYPPLRKFVLCNTWECFSATQIGALPGSGKIWRRATVVVAK